MTAMSSHKTKHIIALVGNPNCGKTTLFNQLTGAQQRVGNWAGVTVESKSGYFCVDQQALELVDLPGTYSLTHISQDGPQDEAITAHFLQSNAVSLVLNIVDAASLERNLYLTLQLLEQNLPVAIALNRMDLLKRGEEICLKTLSQALGCPVFPVVARKGKGIATLTTALANEVSHNDFKITYPTAVEEAIVMLQQAAGDESIPRYQWIRALEGESSAALQPHILAAQEYIVKQSGHTADVVIAKARYDLIENIVRKAHQAPQTQPQTTHWTQYADKFICHRFLGLPIFLGVMYALFFFAINIGGAFQDFFEMASETIFVDGLAAGLTAIQAPAWLLALLVSGVGKGLSTILTFVPVIGAMFFALAFLEDCGYMARAAFVMDRLMRAIGLPGKSFVPMMIGFGCNVPAIMGARTLDNKRDRILAVMMSPFMSCGARLAIFTVFVSAFFPEGGQNIVFWLYIIGIVMAIVTGLLLKKTLLKGEVTPLLLEMPLYQWPHWQSLRLHCWHRLRKFIVNAGKLILPVCILLGVLNHISYQGKWLAEPNQTSLLASVGQSVVPIFKPIGIEEDNWPAAVGLFAGLLAKEVVIGTLNSLYADPQSHVQASFEFKQSMKEAFATIPENFMALSTAWKNPIAAKAPDANMSHHAYGEMVKRFHGQASAFAYLLFVLLYFPCISATAAMVREVQKGWTVFSVCWTTGLAYALAVIYYQSVTFHEHPGQSLFWITLWVSVGILTWVGIQRYSRVYLPRIVPTPVVLT